MDTLRDDPMFYHLGYSDALVVEFALLVRYPLQHAVSTSSVLPKLRELYEQCKHLLSTDVKDAYAAVVANPSSTADYYNLIDTTTYQAFNVLADVHIASAVGFIGMRGVGDGTSKVSAYVRYVRDYVRNHAPFDNHSRRFMLTLDEFVRERGPACAVCGPVAALKWMYPANDPLHGRVAYCSDECAARDINARFI